MQFNFLYVSALVDELYITQNLFRDEVKELIKINRKKGSRTLEEYESKINKVYIAG